MTLIIIIPNVFFLLVLFLFFFMGFFLGCQMNYMICNLSFFCRDVYRCHQKLVFGVCINVGCCYLI